MRSILKKSFSSRSATNLAYDVIVVGGGHAGTEACAAAARAGANTLLVTHKLSTIGAMSCNPSFGGIGKGHLMKEVDALDGLCCRICDLSGINFKILNSSRGPAVWGYRAQIDRELYRTNLQTELFQTPNLNIIEASVEDLIVNHPTTIDDYESRRLHCAGIILGTGEKVHSKSVVLTAGTFLRGEIHLGLDVTPAGRMGDEPAIGIAKTIESLGFKMGRLKTGTPPRIEKKNIDYSLCEPQIPDNPPRPFSFLTKEVAVKPENQVPCYLTHTNKDVENVVRKTLKLNHHVAEEANGPRYCPSLESKVLRFPQPQQVWLEPEGFDSDVVYPQGLSCTMPLEYQQELVNCIPSLRNVKIFQPGYGVKYDYINPTEINNRLETNKVAGLYFAGQINGTTGYEEAAAQGLVAGANAACEVLGKPPLIINRSDGYIGILIEDLTTQGISEPYRMFTSRADVKAKFRPDNADIRLTEKGYNSGIVSENRYLLTKEIGENIEEALNHLKSDFRPGATWKSLLGSQFKNSTGQIISAQKLLGEMCPRISINSLAAIDDTYKKYTTVETLAERIAIECQYYVILQRENDIIQEINMNSSLRLPKDIDYLKSVCGLTTEARERLNEIRPDNIAAAARIPGVTASTITTLYFYCKNASGS